MGEIPSETPTSIFSREPRAISEGDARRLREEVAERALDGGFRHPVPADARREALELPGRRDGLAENERQQERGEDRRRRGVVSGEIERPLLGDALTPSGKAFGAKLEEEELLHARLPEGGAEPELERHLDVPEYREFDAHRVIVYHRVPSFRGHMIRNPTAEEARMSGP